MRPTMLDPLQKKVSLVRANSGKNSSAYCHKRISSGKEVTFTYSLTRVELLSQCFTVPSRVNRHEHFSSGIL